MNVINNALIGVLSLSYTGAEYAQFQNVSCSMLSIGTLNLSTTYLSASTIVLSAPTVTINTVNLSMVGALHRLSITDLRVTDPMIDVNFNGLTKQGGFEICDAVGAAACGVYALSDGVNYTGIDVAHFLSTGFLSVNTVRVGTLSTATNISAIGASALSSAFIGGLVSLSGNGIYIGAQFIETSPNSVINVSGLGVGCSISITATVVGGIDRVSMTYPYGVSGVSSGVTVISTKDRYISTPGGTYGVNVSIAYITIQLLTINFDKGVYLIEHHGGHEFHSVGVGVPQQPPMYAGYVPGVAGDPFLLGLGRRFTIYPSLSVQSRPSQFGMTEVLTLSAGAAYRVCLGYENLISNVFQRYSYHWTIQRFA